MGEKNLNCIEGHGYERVSRQSTICAVIVQVVCTHWQVPVCVYMCACVNAIFERFRPFVTCCLRSLVCLFFGTFFTFRTFRIKLTYVRVCAPHNFHMDFGRIIYIVYSRTWPYFLGVYNI